MGVQRPRAGASGSVYQTRPRPGLVRRSGAGFGKCLFSGESDRMRGQQRLICHLRGEAPAPADREDLLRDQESPAASPTRAATAPKSPSPYARTLDRPATGCPAQGGLDRHQRPAVCTDHSRLRVLI